MACSSTVAPGTTAATAVASVPSMVTEATSSLEASAVESRETSTSTLNACEVPGGVWGGQGGGLGDSKLAIRWASTPCSSMTEVRLLTPTMTPIIIKQQQAGMP